MEALKHNEALKFILAGKATFTFLNPQTGNRFTFKVKKAKVGDLWFVSLLTGADNNSDYSFIGFISKGNFKTSTKSTISKDAKSFKTFGYVFYKLMTNTLDEFIEIYHEGKCGRCGKKLTTPDSIKSGFGPECIKLMRML